MTLRRAQDIWLGALRLYPEAKSSDLSRKCHQGKKMDRNEEDLQLQQQANSYKEMLAERLYRFLPTPLMSQAYFRR